MAAMLARQRQSGRSSLPADQPWTLNGPALRNKLDALDRSTPSHPHSDTPQVRWQRTCSHCLGVQASHDAWVSGARLLYHPLTGDRPSLGSSC